MFGGLRLESGDRTITRFQTRKAAALLAYLAIYPERIHSRDELAEMFWPESEKDQAAASLRTALASLRRQLEPPGVAAGTIIEATRSTIGFQPGAVETDVHKFHSCLESAETSSLPEDKLRFLTIAIECYSGPLLPELYEDWVESERDALRQTYLDAIRKVVRMHAAKRDYGSAIRLAERGVAADPICEESRRDLMSLYAAAGQPTAALRQYEQLESLLAKQAATKPSAATTNLADKIRASSGREVSETHGRAGRPAPVSSPSSAGVPACAELVEQAVTPALPKSPVFPVGPQSESHPLTPSPSRDRATIPVPLNRFFGRDIELGALEDMLRPGDTGKGERLVTLTGAGGCGKTRLAVEAASRAEPGFEGAVWFASLAEVSDRRQVPGALLATLRIKAATGEDPISRVAEEIDHRKALLVMDNFEQIVGGSGVVEQLLARAPKLSCLVTSRRKLGIPGEKELIVAPLAIPNGSVSPEDLVQIPSVQLFVDRAQAARPDFQLTQYNAPAIAALCRSLEGIPLALELAAARAQSLTPGQIVERLSDKFGPVLTARRNDREARHSSLRAAIEWSYMLLTPEQQRMFTQLSVFSGGCTAEAAEEICQEPSAVEYLSQLRERSMIVSMDSRSGLRFRMLESLREFAASELKHELKAGLERRHAITFLSLAEMAEAEINGPNAAHWLDRLEDDYGNLRAALVWSVANDGEIGLNMAGALWSFLRARGHIAEEREIIGELIRKYPNAPAGLRAKALTTAGILACTESDVHAGQAFFEQSLAARREVGWGDGIASSLANLGITAFDSGDYELARSSYEEAIELARVAGNEWRMAVAMNNLGNVARAVCNWREAESILEECLSVRRRIGDKRGTATTLNNLGQVKLALGRNDRARECQEESLEIYSGLADKPGTAYASDGLGELCILDGDLDAARTYFMDSLKLRAELRDLRELATSLDWFAELFAANGNFKRAAFLWAAADRLRQDISSRQTPAVKDRREKVIERVRSSSKESDFNSAWSAGSKAHYQQVVADLLPSNR